MSSTFLSDGVWNDITNSVKHSKLRAYAAVAFLAKGGAKQLPLKRGDVLVVNACDRIVKSGQTNPSELLMLQQKGVRVYSVDNLHAKVFVTGKCVYVGSTNVSTLSANDLVESAVRITDPETVRTARTFVESLALNELGPSQLKALKKIYHPPRFAGGVRRKQGARKKIRPSIPRMFVAQLERQDRDEEIQALVARGTKKAAAARRHPRIWVDDDFEWSGKCRFAKDDKVIQVTRESDGSYMVEEAATVLHVEAGVSNGGAHHAIVFVERPDSRRRRISAAAAKFGCTQKLLRSNGQIRNHSAAQLLLKNW